MNLSLISFKQMMGKENLIEKLHEENMLYYVLGSLISADSLVDIDACHKALNCLEALKRDFETSKLKDDPKLKSLLDDAEDIIKRCAFVPTVREAPPA